MIGWKTLTSRSGLARQVLMIKRDVKFVTKRLNYPIWEDKLKLAMLIVRNTRIYLTVDNLFANQEKRQCIMLNKRRRPRMTMFKWLS